jgi:hypothetical protein
MRLRRFLLAALAVLAIGVVAAPAASASSDCYSQPRGCVSVGGYFRSDGTYVAPYVRNYPGSGPASRGGYVPTTGYAPTRLPRLRYGRFTVGYGNLYTWHFRGRSYRWFSSERLWRTWDGGGWRRTAASLAHSPAYPGLF